MQNVKKYFLVCFTIIIFTFAITIIYKYLKWEYLSEQFASDFVEPIINDSHRGCFAYNIVNSLDNIHQIKVMKYHEDAAKVFLQDDIGNKWLLTFIMTRDGWTTYSGSFCNVEILYSAIGGSAQEFFWY